MYVSSVQLALAGENTYMYIKQSESMFRVNKTFFN